ncbi:MAG: DUF2079 domain-containing protein [Kastovskya adunca ATA6-11-RM4]|nr:DUF2079 domain-containing protein [Kastovskya adunca ATA6-11-RM4]
MIVVSALILFAASSLRHALIQSNAWDLGIFDQAVYLISQGQTPFSSFLGFHIIGDHAAWLFYPLALLYKISPNVHWLLGVQAIALAGGAIPTWYLARLGGLEPEQSVAVVATYLLFPVVFNTNLFDFHPEVFALPALLTAILAARLGRVIWFVLAIIVILGCKSIMALTVASLGFWLLVFDQRRLCGAIALVAGIAWFLLATEAIIPSFGGGQEVSLARYAYLGGSALEIAKNVFLKPGAVISVVFSWLNLKYLVLLFLPVIWGLSPAHLTPLVGAFPALALNLLADYEPQKSLVYQYSLPILPFILVAIISTLAAGKGFLRSKRAIVLWSLFFFFALARWSYFFTKYMPTLDTWQASREAIALVQTQGGVLTSEQLAPQVSQRPLVKLALPYQELPEFESFQYVLLNTRHPGVNIDPSFAKGVAEKVKRRGEFQLRYQRDDVFLFEKIIN